jgi:CRP/FNR family transcriptional regulator
MGISDMELIDVLTQHFGPALAQELAGCVLAGTAPAQQRLFAPGTPCRQFLLLLEGRVRVQILSPQGREIVLYRLEPGQACLMTTCCLLGGNPYAAEGMTETPIRFASLGADDFQALLARSVLFRVLVFGALGSRLAELMGRVQEVALQRIDVRLTRFLLQHAPPAPNALRLTHARIAIELGSAREVVSRQLKQFEHHGWIEQTRGCIVLRERTALQALIAAA